MTAKWTNAINNSTIVQICCQNVSLTVYKYLKERGSQWKTEWGTQGKRERERKRWIKYSTSEKGEPQTEGSVGLLVGLIGRECWQLSRTTLVHDYNNTLIYVYSIPLMTPIKTCQANINYTAQWFKHWPLQGPPHKGLSAVPIHRTEDSYSARPTMYGWVELNCYTQHKEFISIKSVWINAMRPMKIQKSYIIFVFHEHRKEADALEGMEG